MPSSDDPLMPARERRHDRRLGTLAAFVISVTFAGCGSVGMEGVGGPPAQPPTPPKPPVTTLVTLSGVATFSRVPTSGAGLDYAATVSKPIRNAIVQVRSSSASTVLYQSSTDALGNWSISAPRSANVNLVVMAELGTPTAVNTKVVDNTTSDAIYSVYLAKTTTTSDETGIVINATSGWTGSSYGAARTSAPFAILDTIYQAQHLIRSADAGVSFPLLVVEWSPNNSAATIKTSAFNPTTGRIAILGKEDEDTDEFDTHVIAHEWGHWHEQFFSRSDSLGGPHGFGDILDETVAFSEGWGNAFSGMVNRNPIYIDTSGVQQANSDMLDLEANAVAKTAVVGGGDPRTVDGGWSELSVQELLWDAFDGTGGISDADADGVALGFAPLYQVVIGQQKTFSGFTSIYSFLYHLKLQNPSIAAAMTTLEANENIGPHDAYQQTTPGLARYTQVPTSGTALTTDVDGNSLTTYDDYGPMSATSAGNRLYNRLLFSAVAPSTGTFRIRATPLTGSHDLILRRPTLFSPNVADAVYGGSEYLDFNATAGTTVVFSVGSFTTATNATGVTPFQIQFGTPAQVGKPQIDPQPVMPSANG